MQTKSKNKQSSPSIVIEINENAKGMQTESNKKTKNITINCRQTMKQSKTCKQYQANDKESSSSNAIETETMNGMRTK